MDTVSPTVYGGSSELPETGGHFFDFPPGLTRPKSGRESLAKEGASVNLRVEARFAPRATRVEPRAVCPRPAEDEVGR